MTMKKKLAAPPPAVAPLAPSSAEAVIAAAETLMATPLADLDAVSGRPAPEDLATGVELVDAAPLFQAETGVPQLKGPSAQDFRGWVNTLHHHGFLSDGDARALKEKIDTWDTQH